MVVGNLIGKIRRNKLSGVRTPWSLASDVSWSKSNRLGGWVLVLMGIAMIVTVLATRSPIAVIWALSACAILMLPILFVYSYLV